MIACEPVYLCHMIACEPTLFLHMIACEHAHFCHMIACEPAPFCHMIACEPAHLCHMIACEKKLLKAGEQLWLFAVRDIREVHLLYGVAHDHQSLQPETVKKQISNTQNVCKRLAVLDLWLIG